MDQMSNMTETETDQKFICFGFDHTPENVKWMSVSIRLPTTQTLTQPIRIFDNMMSNTDPNSGIPPDVATQEPLNPAMQTHSAFMPS